MIELTPNAIDTSPLLDRVQTPAAGAVVLFLGTAREITGSRRTDSLDYECYPEMAQRKLAELETEARRRWPITECCVVHRLGHLRPGEISVAVAVSTPHRSDAFAAARWLIDAIKTEVPIWKRENWSDGAADWIHPTSSADH
ncbi:MAG TPA: molybdenum cofactor biosynthesis protein MoaE [Pirellulales bacterium]|nr:molybdenum cofactor biosynthesis protein MoaE [Pirellulales bacterium]